MAALTWGDAGKRLYKTGVDRGVLYLPDNAGAYTKGYAWSGLTTVTSSPSGAESNKTYADNRVYANLLSAEEYGLTIEALWYPDEFGVCDGTAEPEPGVSIGQQNRKTFAFCWRSLIGNDLVGTDFGYELNIAYGCLASPSEQTDTTVNDSPEPGTFSWDVTTTPVELPGFRPTAKVTVNSTKTDAAKLLAFEDILYGRGAGTTAPRLPLPAEVLTLLADAA